MRMKTACLGVTESDWLALGNSALEGFNFPIARKAFLKLRDLKWVERIIEL